MAKYDTCHPELVVRGPSEVCWYRRWPTVSSIELSSAIEDPHIVLYADLLGAALLVVHAGSAEGRGCLLCKLGMLRTGDACSHYKLVHACNACRGMLRTGDACSHYKLVHAWSARRTSAKDREGSHGIITELSWHDHNA
eukprot:1161704-Pelagomonas_calceolata.AAC.8